MKSQDALRELKRASRLLSASSSFDSVDEVQGHLEVAFGRGNVRRMRETEQTASFLLTAGKVSIAMVSFSFDFRNGQWKFKQSTDYLTKFLENEL